MSVTQVSGTLMGTVFIIPSTVLVNWVRVNTVSCLEEQLYQFLHLTVYNQYHYNLKLPQNGSA